MSFSTSPSNLLHKSLGDRPSLEGMSDLLGADHLIHQISKGSDPSWTRSNHNWTVFDKRNLQFKYIPVHFPGADPFVFTRSSKDLSSTKCMDLPATFRDTSDFHLIHTALSFVTTVD